MTKKFRVWSDYHKKFVVQGVEFGLQRLFEDFSVSLMGKWQRNEDYEMPFRISDYKIQQWTGLTDSQGVEIYEGDIVSCSAEQMMKNNTPIRCSKEHIGEVKYPCFIRSTDGVPIFPSGVKIIGNIFQTPELLEKC